MAAPDNARAEPIIHLHRNVVERLSREVWAAFESAPPVGMEIGGLLLGEAASQAHFVEIQDFDPLLCEDRPDHRFVLSNSEHRALHKMQAARRSMHDGRLQVVGCYRSQIGEGLALSEEDLSFARACFGDSFGAFLLIKPTPNGDLRAGFFVWGIDSTYTFQEFPFDTRLLGPAREGPSSYDALSHPESVERIDEPSRVESTPSAVSFERPAFRATPPAEPEAERHLPHTLLGQSTSASVSGVSAWPGHRFPLQWQLLVAALAVVLSVAGYRVYRNRTPAVVAADAAGLALQAERRENGLRVSWDRDAPAVRSASKGVLLIRDGDLAPRELPLDVEQLRSGGAVYVPVSARVQFRLEVTETDNTKATATVLTVVAPSQNLTPELAVENRQPDTTSAREQKSGAYPAAPASKRDLPASVAQAHRPTETKSVPSRPPALPSNRAAHQPASTAPAAATRSMSQASIGAAFVTARPIGEIRPNLTASVRSTVTSPVEVQVKVRIDESGRVIRADPVALTGPASTSLVEATRSAALLWKFAPAMRGNQPIASEAVLKFSYAPTR